MYTLYDNVVWNVSVKEQDIIDKVKILPSLLPSH